MIDNYPPVERHQQLTLRDVYGSPLGKLQLLAQKMINPSVYMDVEEQIDLMSEVNAGLGLELPDLTKSQLGKIALAVDSHPGYRVVPTQLPEAVWQRQELYVPSPDSVLAQEIPSLEPPKTLHIPSTLPGILYMPYENNNLGVKELGQIWFPRQQVRNGLEPVRYPKGVHSGSPEDAKLASHDLRYIGLNGKIVDRELLFFQLIASRKGILHEDGSVWTFPVMDISDTAKPGLSDKEFDPIISPESRINVQLIHLLAGRPKNEDVTEFVNEYVYIVNNFGRPVDYRYRVGITWIHKMSRIRLAPWRGHFSESEIPRGVSGL